MSDAFSGILLYASQGRLLSSLRVLLKSRYPQMEIEQSEDQGVIAQILSQGHPRLLILDSSLLAITGWGWVNEIKQAHHDQSVLILTHRPEENHLAQKDGCPTLALEGLTCSTLAGAVDGFIHQN